MPLIYFIRRYHSVRRVNLPKVVQRGSLVRFADGFSQLKSTTSIRHSSSPSPEMSKQPSGTPHVLRDKFLWREFDAIQHGAAKLDVYKLRRKSANSSLKIWHGRFVGPRLVR
jgi:hypothetical protein